MASPPLAAAQGLGGWPRFSCLMIPQLSDRLILRHRCFRLSQFEPSMVDPEHRHALQRTLGVKYGLQPGITGELRPIVAETFSGTAGFVVDQQPLLRTDGQKINGAGDFGHCAV